MHANCRYFCGPNARKSSALAKQQKKRPRGDKTQDKTSNKTAGDAQDDDSASGDSSSSGESSSGDESSSSEDDAPPAKKKVVARGQNVRKGIKASISAKASKAKAAAKGVKGAASKGTAAGAKRKLSAKTPTGKVGRCYFFYALSGFQADFCRAVALHEHGMDSLCAGASHSLPVLLRRVCFH